MRKNLISRRARQWSLAGLLTLSSIGPLAVQAQGVDLANRPVGDLRIEGLQQVSEALALNQVRLQKGDPYNPALVQEDIVRLTHLGRFGAVTAKVEPQADGTLIVTYQVKELATLADVLTVGNKEISDQELVKLSGLRSGDPVDSFLIQRAINQMKAEYEKKGYFQAEIGFDQQQLDESNLLIFRVREGAMSRLKEIRFEGNTLFEEKPLMGQIKSRTYFFILRKGEVNREQLEQDAAKLRDFYRDAGYLDAQVGRRIDISPDQREAVVVFVINEGRQYTIDRIIIEGNELFSSEQIMAAMLVKPGDVLVAEKVKKSYDAVLDLYGKLGFIETRIERGPGTQGFERVFHETEPRVDLVVRINEGKAYNVGKVMVSGNLSTKDKVVQRQIRGIEPGRRFDRTGITTTEQRLRESPLFSDASVTVLGDPEDETRDVLVEVKERQTGSISFGAGISSDSGIVGAIELTQRNFDIADVPESWGEFFTGRSFRGAGQYFNLSLQPGNEFSRYSVSFRDPAFLETDYFLDLSAFYVERERDNYDETRGGGTVGIGQRFGDVWSASIRARGENVEVDSIASDAPRDVFDVQGTNLITSLGFAVTRNTTDSGLFPTKGSLTELSISRAGLLGGAYEFTLAEASYRKFWTVDEDFFGYKTVVTFRSEVGYIFEDVDEVPLFERFYAGGRTLRGFSFRGIGPLGLLPLPSTALSDDHVGGTWLFIAGLEYNFPIYQDTLRGVVFVDSGTVANDVSFGEYRLAVGAGVRLKVPFLGQAPFALDFAVPIMKEEGDDTRIFSFDISLPFR